MSVGIVAGKHGIALPDGQQQRAPDASEGQAAGKARKIAERLPARLPPPPPDFGDPLAQRGIGKPQQPGDFRPAVPRKDEQREGPSEPEANGQRRRRGRRLG